MKKIKNYTSSVPAERSVMLIEGVLIDIIKHWKRFPFQSFRQMEFVYLSGFQLKWNLLKGF